MAFEPVLVRASYVFNIASFGELGEIDSLIMFINNFYRRRKSVPLCR